MESIPWHCENGQLVSEFTFSDFAEAMKFVSKVGELAESVDHHPDIDIRYNRVILRLFTHSEGRITDADHDLAALIGSIG
ncbi:MAG TPA: 4a-hydroxytetrahydrobiopterin dehydratase [Acidimicrobiales bacterium]|nr:4a-hydroxytetrahydrobiopterin dehydratase [Acidimicrobiales bacterium]